MPSIEELKEAVAHWEEVEKMVVHHHLLIRKL